MTGDMEADRTLANALVGGWLLVAWTIEYPHVGRVTQPFGPHPQGLLVYTADGHMSVVLQRPDRPALSRADVHAVGDAEKAAAFDGYMHYAGRWRVENGNVIHRVDYAVNPNLIGTALVRSASLDGEALELGGVEPLVETPGQTRRHRVLWKRARHAGG